MYILWYILYFGLLIKKIKNKILYLKKKKKKKKKKLHIKYKIILFNFFI